MKSKKIIELQGVGEVLLERSSRAKHVNLSIKPFKGVRIAVPKGVSFRQAEGVARSKIQWLQTHMDRMAGIEEDILAQQSRPPINHARARRLIVRRLDELAGRYGFAYNRVFVRNQRTRWGSCSQVNNINLNINLIHLPEALLDYTILHELVHTRIKNHGPKFWEELGKYISDPRQMDQELNRFWMLLVDTD